MEKKNQSMCIGKTKTTDASAFPWPLFPRDGEPYEPKTPMARRGDMSEAGAAGSGWAW